MTNKTKIINKLEELDLTLGCYDNLIEKLSNKAIDKVLENLEYGSTDVCVKTRGKEYVVEIYHVDNEVDFGMITTTSYKNTYGRTVSEQC